MPDLSHIQTVVSVGIGLNIASPIFLGLLPQASDLLKIALNSETASYEAYCTWREKADLEPSVIEQIADEAPDDEARIRQRAQRGAEIDRDLNRRHKEISEMQQNVMLESRNATLALIYDIDWWQKRLTLKFPLLAASFFLQLLLLLFCTVYADLRIDDSGGLLLGIFLLLCNIPVLILISRYARILRGVRIAIEQSRESEESFNWLRKIAEKDYNFKSVKI